MSQACPERITQSRELAGLSKTELAERLNLSAAAITQWERGSKHPTAENLAALAKILNFPMQLLMRPMPVELTRKGPLSFRSWSSAATRRANRKAKRLAELVAEAFLWLDEQVSFPELVLPEIGDAPLDLESIQEVAKQCRRMWGLGDRPILKLGELLEAKGIVIGTTTFGDERFDAFSCIISQRPFIFIGDDKKDRARARFDSAHELGHLIFHQNLSEEELLNREIHKRVESEANLFAAAFLMPAEVFRLDAIDVSLNGFLKLKSKWATSVQAMVHWSYDLGLIGRAHYEELFRQMSIKGWRRAQGEPLDEMVPNLCGSLGKRSLDILQNEGVLHNWEVPSALPLPLDVLCGVFQAQPSDFEPAPALRKIIPMNSDDETLGIAEEKDDLGGCVG